jgi:membrane-bound lytic murein transglycosylase C
MVLAIAKTESRFNSKAVSNKNARGIMQIVPATAGIEAWKYVYGKDSIPPHDSVFDNPSENIKLGCAYIASLDRHYFKKIKDPISKMYCLIAAYNTGASNVAKAFVNEDDISNHISKDEYDMLSKYRKLNVKLEIMLEKINSSDSEVVKENMLNNLPYQQTVDYLNKVLGHMENL